MAGDNLLVREGIVRLLSSAADLEVARSVRGLRRVLAAVDEEQPDVVLTDTEPDHVLR